MECFNQFPCSMWPLRQDLSVQQIGTTPWLWVSSVEDCHRYQVLKGRFSESIFPEFPRLFASRNAHCLSDRFGVENALYRCMTLLSPSLPPCIPTPLKWKVFLTLNLFLIIFSIVIEKRLISVFIVPSCSMCATENSHMGDKRELTGVAFFLHHMSFEG